jgi:hypothetical protein
LIELVIVAIQIEVAFQPQDSNPFGKVAFVLTDAAGARPLAFSSCPEIEGSLTFWTA